MNKNYIITFKEASTSIGNEYPRQTSIMEIDGVGVIVRHKKGYIPTDKDLRSHLIGLQDDLTIIIKANSLEEALAEFNSYEECTTGTKFKAWELSTSSPIVEYSGCKYMLDKGGYTSCQRFAEPNEVDSMVCVLDGLSDPPCDCPINNQKNSKGWRSEINNIGDSDILVKQFFQTVIPMQPLINGIKPRFVK